MADFSTQQVGGRELSPGYLQSNVTAAQPIPNSADADAINKASRAIDPITKMFSMSGDGEDENQRAIDEVKNNFQNSLFNIQQAKQSGALNDKQAEAKAIELTQKFSSQNPHLREDFNSIVKELKGTYKTSKEAFEGNAVEQGQEEAQKKLVTDATSNGHINAWETDPNKIYRGVVAQQTYNAGIAQLEQLSKDQNYRNSILAEATAKQGLAQGQLNLDKSTLDFEEHKKTVVANNALSDLSQAYINNTQVFLEDVLNEYNKAPNDPKAKADLRARVDAYKAKARNDIAAIPNSIYYDPALKDNAIHYLDYQLEPVDKLLSGEMKVETFDNEIKVRSGTATIGALNSKVGKELAASNALVRLVGETAASVNISQTVAVDYFSEIKKELYDPVTGGVEPNKSYLEDTSSGSDLRNEVLPATQQRLAKVAMGKGTEQDKADMLAWTDSLLRGIAKDPSNGSAKPKAWGEVLNYTASDAFGMYAEREKPPWSKEAIANVGQKSIDQFADPGVKLVRDTLGKFGNIEATFDITWSKGKVTIEPKPYLEGDARIKALQAANDVRPVLGGLTNWVKSTAHFDYSRDYPQYFEAMIPHLTGADPTKMSTTKAGQAKLKEFDAKNPPPATIDGQRVYESTPPTYKYSPPPKRSDFTKMRINGEDYLIQDEKTLNEFLDAEGFSPVQKETLVQSWRESQAKKEREASGQRVKKGE